MAITNTTFGVSDETQTQSVTIKAKTAANWAPIADAALLKARTPTLSEPPANTVVASTLYGLLGVNAMIGGRNFSPTLLFRKLQKGRTVALRRDLSTTVRVYDDTLGKETTQAVRVTVSVEFDAPTGQSASSTVAPVVVAHVLDCVLFTAFDFAQTASAGAPSITELIYNVNGISSPR